MQQAIAAVMVVILCLTAALAALSTRRSQPGDAGSSRSPRWQVTALCFMALAVAVAVLTIYLRV